MKHDDHKTSIARMAEMPERRRRRVLRSHREAGFTEDDHDIELRDELDTLLSEIGWMELQAQVNEPTVDDIRSVAGFKELLEKSPAFGHYLDTYLYFKVRFAAGRFALSEPATGENWNIVALPSPPDLPDGKHDVAELNRKKAQESDEIKDALLFLDGYGKCPWKEKAEHQAHAHSQSALAQVRKIEKQRLQQIETGEADKFDLWLRGLLPRPDDEERFKALVRGIFDWSSLHCKFYVSLERGPGHQDLQDKWEKAEMKEGEWHLHNPMTARFGVNDLYWLARILGAEVDPRGIVTYVRKSWLHLFPGLNERFPNAFEGRDFSRMRIFKMEEVLRSVFDYACDLIQNAVEMAEYTRQKAADPDLFPQRPKTTADWRAAHDRELADIDRQRQLRVFQEEIPYTAKAEPASIQKDTYWSERIRTGAYQENLIGLALSGGGIRSATFCLGVIQRLKELDLLRRIDYLSTVSGGGYIGSWLLGNVKRTQYWLSPRTNWFASITHLRRYSKYLAPDSGALSADTWVMWGTWIRNALLIQLTAVTLLMALMAMAIAGKLTFEAMVTEHQWMHVPLVLLLLLLGFTIGSNLVPIRPSGEVARKSQQPWIVTLAWVGSMVTAALLWYKAQGDYCGWSYSQILVDGLTKWYPGLTFAFFLILLVLSIASVWPPRGSGRISWKAIVVGLLTAAVTSGAAHLAISAVVYVFVLWAAEPAMHGWYAYVFGPTLVLLAVMAAMILFIGMVGGTSQDWRREWWTRFGSWLAIYGVGILALGMAAVLAPNWMAMLWTAHSAVPWAAAGSWIASTIGGLIAGKSGRTKGEGTGSSSQLLELVARVGAAIFIVGAVIGVSVLLRFLMVKILLPSTSDYFSLTQLNALLSHAFEVQISGWAGTLVRPTGMAVTLLALFLCSLVFCWRFNLNIFGLNQFYSNRLVRCYLGATRWMPGLRKPHPFTGFDGDDDLELETLHTPPMGTDDMVPFRGPFPIINCSLNLGGSSDLEVHTRQSASFTLTPLYAGSDRPQVGYAPVLTDPDTGLRFADGVTMGRAVSISGAAASPNMGHNTSPLVAVLMTMFNVRLGWWFPNPGRDKWFRGSPFLSLTYLLFEFFGRADEKSKFVNVSDGGHFENLGIYELVRRRAKVIIVCDAECDPGLRFESLGNAIRLCRVDFHASIELDVASVRRQEDGNSRSHCAVGRVTYSNGSVGYIIYLKASLTGNEETEIQQYQSSHEDFPHESTLNQFFTEDQFESYRRLGHHVAQAALREVNRPDNMVDIAAKLWDTWAPASVPSSAFLTHTKTLDGIWERFRSSGDRLGDLLIELQADKPLSARGVNSDEFCACLELLQLMENVFVDLRMDDYWEHPDNRGWAMLFTMWAKSPRFRESWEKSRHTFGIRFEYFCAARLGLEKDDPVRRA